MTRDTKQVMRTQGHMNHKMSRELLVGMHVQLYSKTGSVCHFFWRDAFDSQELHMLNMATQMGSPTARWAASLAAT